ncbi:MAG TPA: dNTP triphosphohydrolase, partial [Candidatus Acidoferrales bacterium]|nr:dNTP triphosphohydrolase [Candidatus Acidoferrales bacterium]
KRLSDVTQVVSADNAHVFHNRLTHSLQVAQVGQSIAEEFDRSQNDLARDCVNVDVVEAACLAHDLGHPPFGHTAEDELKEIANESGLADQFEGNAQSLRIVTKLAFRSPDHLGLNLTRATLAALLKYPWLRKSSGKKSEKWGSYNSEQQDFDWAVELLPASDNRTPEAEIMDWADDVTYAVHDMEDFYRAGRIPLHLLSNRRDDRERKDFYDEVFARRKGHAGVWSKYSRIELETAFQSLTVLFEIDQPYAGTQEHRAKLRKFTGQCINQFIHAISLRRSTSKDPRTVEIVPQYEQQVTMLKELTWHYVINASALATQQHGQRKIIRGLFESFHKAAKAGNLRIFPEFYQEKITIASPTEFSRLVIDLISGMTERQCVDHFQTLSGIRINPSFERAL